MITTLKIGPSAVASAAPPMPRFSGYMNSQSSSMFEQEPTASATMASFGRPSLRASPLSRKLSIWNGAKVTI